MDNATEDLILTLQLQDLSDIYEDLNVRGTAEVEGISDARTALSLYIEELQASATIFSDQRLSRTIGEAEGPDYNPEHIHTTATPGYDALRARLGDLTTVNAKDEDPHLTTETVDAPSEAQLANSLKDLFVNEPLPCEESEGSTKPLSSASHDLLELIEGTGEVSYITRVAKCLRGWFKKTAYLCARDH